MGDNVIIGELDSGPVLQGANQALAPPKSARIAGVLGAKLQ